MATDLKKVLSVAGQTGLFNYLAQSKNGVIVEEFASKRRTSFSGNIRVTSLGDVSIYTNDDELSLKEVFRKMNAFLGDADAPSPKSDEKTIKDFFANAIEEYDRDRFYFSHMKKVLEWYNLLKQYASLDFEDDQLEQEEVEDAKVAKPEVAAKKTVANKPTAKKAPAKATSTKAASAKAASAKKSTKSVQRKAN
ncbi:MAG: DUF5606 domain-containing protein [Bacteroidales bacterium]|nr:DUF5606 domain-containing protein [Bacteroidales bacterium]